MKQEVSPRTHCCLKQDNGMFDLNDMMVFAKVVETGSFTAAGKALSLQKSNVSRKVARLEDNLNVRLFNRTTRKLRLTEIGQALYHHAQRIGKEMEDAESLVESMTSSTKGTLKVSASVSTGQHLLAPILPDFLRNYPELNLELQLSNRRIDLIEEGIDIAIRIGKMKDSSMITTHLGTIHIFLFCSPEYIVRCGKPSGPADLVNHRILLMNDMGAGSGNTLRLTSTMKEEKVAITPYCSANDFETLRKLTREGLGVAALPRHLCQDDVNIAALERILPDWEIPSVDLSAVYTSRKGKLPKITTFIEFVKGKFEALHID